MFEIIKMVEESINKWLSQSTSSKSYLLTAQQKNNINTVFILCLLTIFASNLLVKVSAEKSPTNYKLLLITVASDPFNSGFQRFNKSVKAFNLNLNVLGTNQQWLGGDVQYGKGGGYKFNLFNKALSSYKNNNDLIILFVDSYDLIINGDSTEIIKKFKTEFNDAKIVFSAEETCWPDKSLESQYPISLLGGYTFLNSGAFIGYAPSLWQLFQKMTDKDLNVIKNDEDDQLLFTKTFLNSEIRSNFSIVLDNQAKLFQNLFASESDVKLEFEDNIVHLKNTAFSTKPLIIHGNGPSKITLNSLGNYLGKAWTPKNGCRYCNSSRSVVQVSY